MFLYCIKQIDSMLPCLWSVIDHKGCQNVVRTSVTHLAFSSCATFLFLPHFDVICDLIFLWWFLAADNIILPPTVYGVFFAAVLAQEFTNLN